MPFKIPRQDQWQQIKSGEPQIETVECGNRLIYTHPRPFVYLFAHFSMANLNMQYFIATEAFKPDSPHRFQVTCRLSPKPS